MNEVYSVWFKVEVLPTTGPRLIFKREDDFSLHLFHDRLVITKDMQCQNFELYLFEI